MTDSKFGVVFTQTGVPAAGSSDYQKVIDSRWQFMEIEQEGNISVVLPVTAAIASTTRYYEKTIIYRHNLGFFPAFEASITFTGDQTNDLVEIFSDKNTIFLRRLVSTTAHPQQTVTGSFRLYNLDILTDYTAPTEIVSGASAPKTDFGIKFVDGSVPNTSPGDNAVQGFSADTTKKILSIHKHGQKYFNQSAVAYFGNVTAIDTTTDILTVSPQQNGTGPLGTVFFDLTWVQTPGIAVAYFPHDFSTYPAPLSGTNNTVYTIPVDATHIKLAWSYQAAIAGTAIDLTTAGSLTAQMSGVLAAGEDSIAHGMGYPPTYMIAAVNEDEKRFGVGGLGATAALSYIAPLDMMPQVIVRADSRNLTFRGVQSLFSGKYGYIILKDPVEIAQ
jgi:hypothetical protein